VLANGIPERVEQFLYDSIDSIEQLEILLLLHRTPSRVFTADAVAKELRVSADSAAARLEQLRVLGLLTPAAAGEFQFNPGSPDATTVAELARTYSERRVAIITFIFSKPDKLRTFADAFRLKRGS